MLPVTTVGVLVVDDDRELRDLLRFICATAGYPVTEASNGCIALDHLHASQLPLVVLLDWWMPVMNGLELLRVVAQDATLSARHAFVLLTAARTATASIRDQIPSGITVSLMRKPFDLDELLALVAQLSLVVGDLTTPREVTPASKLSPASEDSEDDEHH